MQQELAALFEDYAHCFVRSPARPNENERKEGSAKDDECNFIPNVALEDPFEELTEYQARKKAIKDRYLEATKVYKIQINVDEFAATFGVDIQETAEVEAFLETTLREDVPLSYRRALVSLCLIHAVRHNLIYLYEKCMLALKSHCNGLVSDNMLFVALTTCHEPQPGEALVATKATIDQECYQGLCASLKEASIGIAMSNDENKAYYYGSAQVTNLIKQVVAHHRRVAGPAPYHTHKLKIKPARGGSLRLRVLTDLFSHLLTKPVITTDFAANLNKLAL